jgi:hypothetical protein
MRRFLRLPALYCGALLALSALAAAAPAGAQDIVLSGRILDSASAQPIPGAVVQALDADGAVSSRALSDGVGYFILRLSDGGASTLRIQRIGFRPRMIPIEEALRLREIRLARIPAFLDPVLVVAAQCRRRGRSSPAGLIEQARAGLLSSIVARDVNPAAMTRLTYERRLEIRTRQLLSQRIRRDSVSDGRVSFSAVEDAAGFVRRGFLEDSDGGQTYFAPDAETLLDEDFAAGYCFRVMPSDRSRRNQVGLGFEAADRRAGRVDVNGALWIDTVARELRSIEFRYEGLPNALQAHAPGGRLEFTTLPNGITLISRWSLGLVGMTIDTVQGPRMRRPLPIAVPFHQESGGELAEASWRDGTAWRAPLGRFIGRVTWAGDVPARGVTFALRNTPYLGTSDSTGQLVIDDLLPGTYQLMIIDPDLLTVGLGIETDAEFHSVRDTVQRDLRAMSADD